MKKKDELTYEQLIIKINEIQDELMGADGKKSYDYEKAKNLWGTLEIMIYSSNQLSEEQREWAGKLVSGAIEAAYQMSMNPLKKEQNKRSYAWLLLIPVGGLLFYVVFEVLKMLNVI